VWGVWLYGRLVFESRIAPSHWLKAFATWREASVIGDMLATPNLVNIPWN
jgi:hypothetical protein